MHLCIPDVRRFWSFVAVPVDEAGAADTAEPWRWTGAKSADGHGRFWLGGRHELAHRVSFFLHHGFLPDVVCHTEPVPDDVNPHHLYAGTAAGNVADRQRQGRQARGPRNGRAKLTDEHVAWARDATARGTPVARAASTLSVHRTTLHAALAGKTWRDLGEPPRAGAS